MLFLGFSRPLVCYIGCLCKKGWKYSCFYQCVCVTKTASSFILQQFEGDFVHILRTKHYASARCNTHIKGRGSRDMTVSGVLAEDKLTDQVCSCLI